MKELFEAIRAGELSRVSALVEADTSLAIFAAAILGSTEEIERLLAGNRSLVSALSSDGWTPLHLAAYFGKKTAAQLLLNKGAPVNARSTNVMENTPLHAAAQNGDLETAKALVDAGADVKVRADNNQSPLDLALTGAQQAMVDFLEANGASL